MFKFARQMSFNYLIFSFLILVTSCASVGPIYSKIDKIPDNTGLIYFYRPLSFFGGGVSYDIMSGESKITPLYNGGYYPYFASPGEKEFWAETETKSSITLDIKSGQTYYIKGGTVIGFFIGRPHLMVVAPEIAVKEIADCELIPAK